MSKKEVLKLNFGGAIFMTAFIIPFAAFFYISGDSSYAMGLIEAIAGVWLVFTLFAVVGMVWLEVHSRVTRRERDHA